MTVLDQFIHRPAVGDERRDAHVQRLHPQTISFQRPTNDMYHPSSEISKRLCHGPSSSKQQAASSKQLKQQAAQARYNLNPKP